MYFAFLLLEIGTQLYMVIECLKQFIWTL